MKPKNTSYDAMDEIALRNSPVLAAVMGSEGMRFDSVEDASVFFARELDSVKAQSYDVEYPELTALTLFPKTSDADEGAETVSYRSYDKTGIAKIIDNYSTDLPRADVIGTETFAKIKSLGASYGYSVQELRSARLKGESLDARKSESARYAIDSVINKIAWAGDEKSGLMGVLSAGQSIPLYAIEAGAESKKTSWLEKTADEILDDINGMAEQVSAVTKNVERPDTLCVPSNVFMKISTKRIADTSTTVLKYLLDNSPYLKNVVPASELNADSADTNPYAAASGSGVAFLFKNDEKKLSLENPMPYIQYPVQVSGLETTIPCEARTAGVIVYYPFSCLIAVGVS